MYKTSATINELCGEGEEMPLPSSTIKLLSTLAGHISSRKGERGGGAAAAATAGSGGASSARSLRARSPGRHLPLATMRPREDEGPSESDPERGRPCTAIVLSRTRRQHSQTDWRTCGSPCCSNVASVGSTGRTYCSRTSPGGTGRSMSAAALAACRCTDIWKKSRKVRMACNPPAFKTCSGWSSEIHSMIATASSATSMYSTFRRFWQSTGRPPAAVMMRAVGGRISTTLKRQRQQSSMTWPAVSSEWPGFSSRLISTGMKVSMGKEISASSELKLKYSESSVSAMIWRDPSSLFRSRNMAENCEVPEASSSWEVRFKKKPRAPPNSAAPGPIILCEPSDPPLLRDGP
mmetsp:Transcript_31635/g.69240  ORF Transcript_31635/g.69240 Transcript_31635/m.69240 type:complete len:349 (-) Transcript_31635:335-1381(-)